MAEESPVGAERSAPELPNLAVRFLQVFVSPGKLFDGLRERPVWIGALLLVVVVGLAAQTAIPAELVRESFLERLPRDVSPEQVEGQLRFANAMRFVGTVLFTPIFFAVVAGLLLLVFNVFAGGEAGFRQLFAATAHSSFIVTVGGLLALPLALARRDLQLGFTLALLAPGLERGTYLFRLLNGLNVFGIWATIVLGIAVSRIYRKRSATGPALVLLGLYLAAKAIVAIFGGPAG